MLGVGDREADDIIAVNSIHVLICHCSNVEVRTAPLKLQWTNATAQSIAACANSGLIALAILKPGTQRTMDARLFHL
jgi:hypothetical protein